MFLGIMEHKKKLQLVHFKSYPNHAPSRMSSDIWHKSAIMSCLYHMTMMTDDIFYMMNMGLCVSMEAYWPQESGL